MMMMMVMMMMMMMMMMMLIADYGTAKVPGYDAEDAVCSWNHERFCCVVMLFVRMVKIRCGVSMLKRPFSPKVGTR